LASLLLLFPVFSDLGADANSLEPAASEGDDRGDDDGDKSKSILAKSWLPPLSS
jgi:hypothetical protein